MNHATEVGVVVSVTSVSLMALGFVIDRVLKPWRVRRLAEAEERKALALIASDEMRSAFRVLTGDPGDPTQGLPPVPGLGRRMAAVEEQLKTNGGNSARDVLDKIHAVAVEGAEANARVEAEQRRAARVAGEAAQAAATAEQRATDALRGVHAIRAAQDVMLNAVVNDNAGLWDAIAQINPALDRRRGDHDTSTDPTV